MRIRLFVPAPIATLSDGYAYDRAMLDGLREAGVDATVAELAGRHPLPDDEAHANAQAAWRELPNDTVALIDGLSLPLPPARAATAGARRGRSDPSPDRARVWP